MIANTSDEHALSYRLRKQRICGEIILENPDFTTNSYKSAPMLTLKRSSVLLSFLAGRFHPDNPKTWNVSLSPY